MVVAATRKDRLLRLSTAGIAPRPRQCARFEKPQFSPQFPTVSVFLVLCRAASNLPHGMQVPQPRRVIRSDARPHRPARWWAGRVAMGRPAAKASPAPGGAPTCLTIGLSATGALLKGDSVSAHSTARGLNFPPFGTDS